ncbi:hypothetical protein BC830DRAFT_1219142 [Chytriomyces sp. MP71]|nr:hypothetical protein BC830DRAFT_1219142 [Chytriomyces sp. MP71]
MIKYSAFRRALAIAVIAVLIEVFRIYYRMTSLIPTLYHMKLHTPYPSSHVHVVTTCRSYNTNESNFEAIRASFASIMNSKPTYSSNFVVKSITLTVHTQNGCDELSQRFGNLENAPSITTDFTCYHETPKSATIFDARRHFFSTTNISFADGDLILFLDHCDTLLDSSSLLNLLAALRNTSSTSMAQTRTIHRRFIFANSLNQENVEKGFLEEEYNPYDLAVGTTNPTLNWTAPNTRSPVPPTSSMLMAVEDALYALEILKEFEFECQDPLQQFWIQMALTGITGYHLPVPVFKHIDSSESKRQQRCRIDVRSVKADNLSSLMHLSMLKSRWRPSLSVIVPFYNVPHVSWFLQTLKSLAQQSLGDFEILIVNDGSDPQLPSTKVLRSFEGTIMKADGWWDGFLPLYDLARDEPKCEELTSLLFGDNQSPSYFEDLPPQDLEPSAKRGTPIPLRILHHTQNVGLAETRNTGVRAAQSHNVFFLDPDDLLSPTALEKWALTASASFGWRPRRRETRVSFLHMPVIHFPDPLGPRCNAMHAAAPKSSGIDSDKRTVHGVSPPPKPEELARELRKRNPLTSTSVVSRWDYMAVGGTCPRTALRYFEDYDFWLRMLSFGREGIVSGEVGLFWYRRHEKGMSSHIMRESVKGLRGWLMKILRFVVEEGKMADESWLQEGRMNNPVIFGDLSRGEAERLLRMRNAQRKGESGQNDGDNLDGFMPCYRTFNPINHLLDEYKTLFQEARRQFLSSAKYIKVLEYPMNQPEVLLNGSLTHPITPLEPLYPAHIFPFNLNLHTAATVNHSHVLYMLPWMVTGGADLYDAHVLKTLNSSQQDTSITLVVARNLPNHPHPWSHVFRPLVRDIWHLQLLSNDSRVQREILEYLAESRNCSVAINSRTIVGYDLFEMWGRIAKLHLARHRRFPSKLMDILHLHHPPPDESNWEHRSARVSRFLKKRIVVSHDLKDHLVNVLGHGDLELGKPLPSNSNSACFEDQNGIWQGGRCVPLQGEELDKIYVIHPPLDVLGSLVKQNNVTDSVLFRIKLSNLISMDVETTSAYLREAALKEILFHGTPGAMASDARNAPSLFFIGRLADQKDPLMWINVASKVNALWKETEGPKVEAPHVHIIGDGELMGAVSKRLHRDKYLAPPAYSTSQKLSTTHLHASVPQQRVPEILMTSSMNGVTILTSRLEGLPIIVLESLGLGIPVVAIWCGGIKEAFEIASGRAIEFGFSATMEDGVETVEVGNVKVTRMLLGSLVHVKCEGLQRDGDKRALVDVATVTQSQVESVMAQEVLRILKEGKEAVAGQIGKRLLKWRHGSAIRRRFAMNQFQESWKEVVRQ